jgi:DNA repair photolyase
MKPRPEKKPYAVRPESNPHNRFESTRVEWEDGVELPQAMRIHEETAKSIVSENDSPDIPFRYSVNPYRGCAHACAYCYARPSHEYLGLGAGTDFETQIFAKVNAAALLRKKLSSPKWDREPLTFSGVTDCYQPAEAKLKLTRACLEVCAEFATPVSLITKSTLVLRDTDVLQAVGAAGGVGVVFSIPFLDASVAKAIEPFAPPPEQRFRAMERLSAAGIRTGLSIGPVIPGLNDSDIPKLLARAKECGAGFAFYVMLRLPGSVREVFLDNMRKNFPDRVGKIEHHIRDVREGELYRSDFRQRMSGSGKMAEMVEQLFSVHARKLGLISTERVELRGALTKPAYGAATELPQAKAPRAAVKAGPVMREAAAAAPAKGKSKRAPEQLELGL